MQLILKIIAFIYGLIVRIRNAFYDFGLFKIYKSKLPIVCVGNITVGGNAKTPLSAYLYKELKSRGKTPILLSRGYKSKIKNPYIVLKSDTAEKVGDEPLMLTKYFDMKVLVSPSRVAGVKFIEANNLADTIILDDGLQHRKLARTINIAAVNHDENTKELYYQQKLLPYGRFRESLSYARKRIDFYLLINRSSKKFRYEADDYNKLFGENKVFFGSLKSFKFIHFKEDFNTKDECQFEEIKAKKVIAICGLANPKSFFNSLESFNLNVVEKAAFSDHYKFKENDFLKYRKKYPDAVFVCTLKDAVKISPKWDLSIFILHNELFIEKSEELVNDFLVLNLKK